MTLLQRKGYDAERYKARKAEGFVRKRLQPPKKKPKPDPLAERFRRIDRMLRGMGIKVE